MKIHGKKVKVNVKVKAVEFGYRHTVTVSRGKKSVKVSYILPIAITKKELTNMIKLLLGIFLVSKSVKDFGHKYHGPDFMLKSVIADYKAAKSILKLAA